MTSETIHRLLADNDFLPESKFGQNFLCDDQIIESIIDLCEINPEDKVLEIGPGLGSLTRTLSCRTNNLTCVEIDKRLAEFLDKDDEIKASIISSDFLKLKDYDASEYDVVVSNLPYYVMTDIMKKIIGDCTNCRKMVFMVEDEAIARIIAKPNTKQYGPLSILCELYGEVTREFTVPRNCFIPSPRTTSAVISLTSGNNKLDSSIVKFIDKCFTNRRKKLVNSCPELKGILEELGYDSNIRAEQLMPGSFLELYNAIIK